MSKRHRDEEHIHKKIRKLEKKLLKQKEKLCESVVIEDLAETETPDGTHMETPEDNPQPGCSHFEPETLPKEQELPEEFLIALGEEGKIEEKIGQNINQQIADRWSNIIKMGIKKDNLNTILNKYPTPGNFTLANAPKMNSEITAAVSENVLKRDKKFEYRQNLTGKVLSGLGLMLTDIMKGNLNSVKLIEGINDAAKILCNMNHYDSLTRRHFVFTSVQNCVKQAASDTPIDKYLFGENLSERLKTVKALERSSSSIKHSQAVYKKPNPKFQQPKNLNWKGPSRKPPKETFTRGGLQHQHPPRRTYKQQQSKQPPRRR